MKGRFAPPLRALFLPAALLLASCSGSDPEPMAPLSRADHDFLRNVLDHAVADSVRGAAAPVNAEGHMVVRIDEGGDDKVSVEDRFLLSRGTAGTYQTEIVSHVAVGDTTLLKDMYTFQDSKGNSRAAARSQLAGLHFGADFLGLLRMILARAEGTECEPVQGADTGSVRRFRYGVGDRRGEFTVDRDLLDLVTLRSDEGTDYVVGSYAYRMTIEFDRTIDGMLLPVRTESRFDYSRVFSGGTGSVTVTLSPVRPGGPPTRS